MAFDLQAHRGGIALTVENTLAAFANALEIGVSTLEFDVQVTRDEQVVVTHDRALQHLKCVDTEPAFPNDPAFPYAARGALVKDLTLAQVRTVDVGSKRLDRYPDQQLAPGERMPLLTEVCALVRQRAAADVRLNVELKVEAAAPEQTAPREAFVQAVIAALRDTDMVDRTSIESFDWGALMRTREVEPRLPIIALTNGQRFLQSGMAGQSPWLGGLDIDAFAGSPQQRYVAAAATFAADVVAPVHGDPQTATITDPEYVPFTNQQLVDAAHEAGMAVIPWTVDDSAALRKLVGIGIDGVITNRPDTAREVLTECGLPLPQPYPAGATDD